jgi:hypothetical protein
VVEVIGLCARRTSHALAPGVQDRRGRRHSVTARAARSASVGQARVCPVRPRRPPRQGRLEDVKKLLTAVRILSAGSYNECDSSGGTCVWVGSPVRASGRGSSCWV